MKINADELINLAKYLYQYDTLDCKLNKLYFYFLVNDIEAAIQGKPDNIRKTKVREEYKENIENNEKRMPKGDEIKEEK